ncbi:hypothetical protein C1H46_035443 [Malus baccata]|uniref:Uncharacterized protein n=1 Tax=Malus baccata TaxID=106549 RepID=A0A540KXL4_MALBA|nr:hypothetical protein C1H46_035443 [Malus baccata]
MLLLGRFPRGLGCRTMEAAPTMVSGIYGSHGGSGGLYVRWGMHGNNSMYRGGNGGGGLYGFSWMYNGSLNRSPDGCHRIYFEYKEL